MHFFSGAVRSRLTFTSLIVLFNELIQRSFSDINNFLFFNDGQIYFTMYSLSRDGFFIIETYVYSEEMTNRVIKTYAF